MSDPMIGWEKINIAGQTREGNIDAPFDNWVPESTAASAPVVTHPFKLTDASVGAALKVKIQFGLVNGVIPGGMGDPDDPDLTLAFSGTRYFWLKCVGTFGTPDTYVITVEQTASESMPAGSSISTTGFTSFILIGIAFVSGSSISSLYSYISTNQAVESFGTVNVWGPVA